MKDGGSCRLSAALRSCYCITDGPAQKCRLEENAAGALACYRRRRCAHPRIGNLTCLHPAATARLKIPVDPRHRQCRAFTTASARSSRDGRAQFCARIRGFPRRSKHGARNLHDGRRLKSRRGVWSFSPLGPGIAAPRSDVRCAVHAPGRLLRVTVILPLAARGRITRTAPGPRPVLDSREFSITYQLETPCS